jgi:hypothetical protein
MMVSFRSSDDADYEGFLVTAAGFAAAGLRVTDRAAAAHDGLQQRGTGAVVMEK